MLITLARKPLAGSVANNVLAHGCGALNIDQCRIATSDDFSGVQGFASMKLNAQRRGESDEDWKARVKGGPEQQAALAKLKSLGRWPANVLHDGSESVMEGFPQTKSGTHSKEEASRKAKGMFAGGIATDDNWYGDVGSAARFFKQVQRQPEGLPSQDKRIG